ESGARTRRRSVGLGGRVEEGVHHPDTVEVLAVLEILGEQGVAAGALGGGDDEGVPEVEAEAVLDVPGGGDEVPVDADRLPAGEVGDLRSSRLRRHRLADVPGD